MPEMRKRSAWFGDTGNGVEYEYWDCNECKAAFYVPIEIKRDFANMEDQE